LAIVVLVIFRRHAFDLPLETDECNYAYIAGRLLQGDRLYIDVWDHQPFGVFTLFAAVIAVFGDAPYVFRWLAAGFSIASLVLIFAILRHVAGLRAAGLGAILFALVSSDPGTAGEGCNREIYMNTLILAAWYFALRAVPPLPLRERAGVRVEGNDTPNPALIVLSGFSLALASTIKPIVAVHGLCLAIWIAFQGRSIGRLAWFALGPLLIWMGTSAYFALTQRFSEFVEAALLFNLGYGESGEAFYMRWFRFFAPLRHPFIFESALPLWIAGGVSSLWLLGRTIARKHRHAPLLLLLIVAGYIAVCLSGRFWPHYYYLLIPPMVLAATSFVNDLAATVPGILTRPSGGRAAVLAVLFLLLPSLVIYSESRNYLLKPLNEITVKRYNHRDFWGRAQAANVAAATDPNDEVFVFGNEAEIYYYSRRRCASRYTMITALQVGDSHAIDRMQLLLRDLELHRPRLILVLFDIPDPPAEWKAFLREHYTEPVGWDFHDVDGKPIMFVVARKDSPIRKINWDWDRSLLLTR
jgi:hypothetical protein